MQNTKNRKLHSAPLVLISLLLLCLVYVFQRWDYLNVIRAIVGLEPAGATIAFAFNRSIRLIINDSLCLILIQGLFGEKKYIQLALYVFLFEFLLLLPVYLIMKLNLEGPSEISSPLLSPIHRLIVNPMLMLILIIAFYYQKYLESRRS